MSKRTQLLAEQLVNFQKTNNLTQHQMAEKLKICQTTYNNWINGKCIIAIKYFQPIAAVIGINVSEIIPPEMEVTLSMPNTDNTYTSDALSLHQKLTYHLEGRLAFQIKENERLRLENEELKMRLNESLAK